jgi:catechol 2,3-dioxygenase-like lactoylglutathione lyase family enzyme
LIATHVHHVSFAVHDLAASCAFYEKVLGLVAVPRPDMGLPGAWYGVGASQIHLIETPEGVDVGKAPEGLTPLADHCAFGIEDYDAALAALESLGVEILETRPEIGQLWIRDPDGHILELIDPRGRGAGVPASDA